MRPYVGNKLTIDFTDEARDSWPAVAATTPVECQALIRRLAERLADTGSLKSPEQFRHEGDGVYAIRARCGLRAYGYFDEHRRGHFVIALYRHKKKDKADPRDLELVKNIRNGKKQP